MKYLKLTSSLCLILLSGELEPQVNAAESDRSKNPCSVLLSKIEMSESAAQRHTERDLMIQRYNESDLGFQAELVKSHDTIRVYSKSGKIPEGAKARVLLLHGMGWNTSTHALWRNMTRVLSDPQPTGNEHSAVEARKIHEVLGKDRILVGAEAIDMPAHGVGADATELVNNLSASVDYLASYIQAMKAETPELPVVVIGWSWAGPVSLELQRRHPELVDGLVLLGSTEPGESQQTALTNFIAFADSEFTIEGGVWPRMTIGDEVIIRRNREGLTWISSVSEQIAPIGPGDFSSTPTLFMYGLGDSSVNEATRLAAEAARARDLSQNDIFQLVVLRSIDPSVDWRSHEPFHGLFPENSTEFSPWSEEAYRALNFFIRRLVESSSE